MKKNSLLLRSAMVVCIFVAGIGFQKVTANTDQTVLVSLEYFTSEIGKWKKELEEKIQGIQSNTSQIDKKIETLNGVYGELGEKVQNLEKNASNPDLDQALSFVVVELQPGEKLIAKGGTELILRGGTAKGYFEGVNGLNDITSGKDVDNGNQILLNHLIIVPRDNRGIIAQTKSWVMIRGKYEITK